MEIKKELLKELSKSQMIIIARYIKKDFSKFPDLVSCLVSDDETLAYRASWCIGTCYDIKVKGIELYVARFMNVLMNTKISSVKRNVLRVLNFVDIPEIHHGNLLNSCVSFIEDVKEPIAVKAFSFGILEKMCGFYPEFKSELFWLCEKHKNSKSAGIRSRVNRIFKFLG